MKRAALFLCGLAALMAVGCGKPRPTATVFVRGGPSLLRVLDEVAAQYQAQHPDTNVALDFSCPPCVLPSRPGESPKMDALAMVGDMDIKRLVKSGIITPGKPAVFGYARLKLIVSGSGRAKIRGLGDLLTPDVHKIGIGNPDQTDLGYYTVQALQKAGIYKELSGKLSIARSGCDLLKSVALGIYDAAIVYDFCVSQQSASTRGVDVLPDRLSAPIPMHIVTNTRSDVAAQAQQFTDYASSKAARPYLEQRGVKPK